MTDDGTFPYGMPDVVMTPELAAANPVAIKRWFLNLCFVPNGGDIAKGIGMVPESDEVEAAGLADAQRNAQAFWASGAGDTVVTFAAWYVEGVMAAEQFGHSQRTLEEHLVAFGSALVAGGITAGGTSG